MNDVTSVMYVVVKHVFEEYFAGGIDICGVYHDKNAAFDCLMTESEKMLKFINNNADKYPAHIWLFGSEDYWTACVKEKGITRNIVEIFIREVPACGDISEEEG